MKYRELRERDEDVLNQIQSFNPHALSMIENGMALYRGRGSHFSTGIYQARKQKISYTGHMYYQWILSEDDSWKDFPPRMESHIATTSQEKASYYGEVYVVIPDRSARLGICPSDDIWDSFQRVKDRGFPSLKEWNTSMYDLMTYAEKNRMGISAAESQTSYSAFMNALDEISSMPYRLRKGAPTPYDVETIREEILSDLDPEANSFLLSDYQNFPLRHSGHLGNEVWFTGPCLYVNYRQYRDVMMPKSDR